MAKTVYIIGAGASKSSGAPVMNDFIDKMEFTRYLADDRYSKIFEEALKAIYSLNDIQAKARVDLNNIESILALFEMGIVTGGRGNYDSEQLAKILDSIKMAMAITIEKNLIINNVRDGFKAPGKYFEFFSNLTNKNFDVITFNYDLAFDLTFFAHRSLHSNGLNESENDQPFHLLKLHGALNWFECPQCKNLNVLDYPQLVSCSCLINKGGNTHTIEIIDRISVDCSSDKCHHLFDPVPYIIPPFYNCCCDIWIICLI